MATTRAVVLVALVVAVAGCTEVPGLEELNVEPGEQNGDTQEPTAKGLEIKKFTISDKDLRPGQQARVTLRLKNYHSKPITINDISLYNLNWMSVKDPNKDWKDRCSPTPLQTAKKEVKPEMECIWMLEAPSESELQGFNSKTVNAKLNLDYESSLSNNLEPLKIQFRPKDEIESRSQFSKSYKNGEAVMTVTGENPSPSGGAAISVKLESSGSGMMGSYLTGTDDQHTYKLEYSPDNVFQGCDGQTEPVKIEEIVEDKAEFNCRISSGASDKVERNLILSTSYKYLKSPSLHIEVVSQR